MIIKKGVGRGDIIVFHDKETPTIITSIKLTKDWMKMIVDIHFIHQ